MKTKNIIKVVFTMFLMLTAISCGYNEDEITTLMVDREFAPIALKATVRNQTTIELNWAAKKDVNRYVVEISADDSDFTTLYKTLEVTADQLPIQVALEGETVYSIRVKALSNNGLGDSTWAVITATTLTEQLIQAFEAGDVAATQVTIRWVPNSNVTHITVQPGDINHPITTQEKTDGVATIMGLTGETNYTATLFNSTKIRGKTIFTTGIDVGDNTLVLPTDDLMQMIANAESGDILLLEQGDYRSQTGTIILNKPITIQGLRKDFKPLLKVGFSIVTGATAVNLIDLDLEGDGPNVDNINDVVRYNDAGEYGSLLISGCKIHNYRKSFVAGDIALSTINTVTIENTIVTDAWCNGGDFIDFRKTSVSNLKISTSTFNNVASYAITGVRDFIRIDEAGTTGTGLTTNVVLENCTLYNVSNSATKRLLYVRYNANAITVRNNLITASLAIFTNQSKTADPIFLNNNYFNTPSFFDTTIVGNKIDNSGTSTTLDPGFVNAAVGNFKITNQTLLDRQVGDPRWRL